MPLNVYVCFVIDAILFFGGAFTADYASKTRRYGPCFGGLALAMFAGMFLAPAWISYQSTRWITIFGIIAGLCLLWSLISGIFLALRR